MQFANFVRLSRKHSITFLRHFEADNRELFSMLDQDVATLCAGMQNPELFVALSTWDLISQSAYSNLLPTVENFDHLNRHSQREVFKSWLKSQDYISNPQWVPTLDQLDYKLLYYLSAIGTP